MKDEDGIVQIHLVDRSTGAVRQLTQLSQSVESAFTWSPDGQWIAFVSDGSVMIANSISRIDPAYHQADAKPTE